MGGIGRIYQNHLLDAGFGAGHTSDFPSTYHVALFVTDPDFDGSGTEVAGGATGYTRIPATNNNTFFPAAAGGRKLLARKIVFPQAVSAWGRVQFWALMDASTGGDVVAFGGFGSGGSQISAGDTVTIPANTIIISYLEGAFRARTVV